MKISNLHLCETKNNWEKNILTFKNRKCSRYCSEELVVNLFSYINHIVINDSSFFTRLCGARRGEARRGEARRGQTYLEGNRLSHLWRSS